MNTDGLFKPSEEVSQEGDEIDPRNYRLIY